MRQPLLFTPENGVTSHHMSQVYRLRRELSPEIIFCLCRLSGWVQSPDSRYVELDKRQNITPRQAGTSDISIWRSSRNCSNSNAYDLDLAPTLSQVMMISNAPSGGAGMTFFVVGDIGAKGAPREAVARAMAMQGGNSMGNQSR